MRVNRSFSFPLDEIEARFPRLTSAVQWAIIGSRDEARGALRNHLAGNAWAGEAVNHFGGTLEAIRAGIRSRHVVRRIQGLRQTHPEART